MRKGAGLKLKHIFITIPRLSSPTAYVRSVPKNISRISIFRSDDVENGIVEAAGRHLDAVTSVTRQLKGLGSRHRSVASITMQSQTAPSIKY